MRTLPALATVFALALCGSAQGQAEISVRLSSGVARLGEQVVLDLVVTKANRVEVVEVPALDGLVLGQPAGPFRSSFSQIVNGRRSGHVETTYRIALRGNKEGVFDIPPVVLLVDGERAETKPVRLRVVADITGADLGFLDVSTPSTRVVEGQPFTVELRFGWDASANVNYANLSLPWWGALPGTMSLETPATPRDAEQVVVNDDERVAVERVAGDEDRVVYRLSRSYLPTRSGTLVLPKSFLEFGRRSTPRFFEQARVLSNYFVSDEPLELEVVPLPLEGQPYDYSGAVGSLEVKATADVRDVIVGESIKLTVDWTGAGNLEFFAAPDLGLLESFRAGFHVYGKTESKSFSRRRVVYDLAPLTEETAEIPPVPLSAFDPELGVYVTLASEPIPIRVRPLEKAISLDTGAEKRFARDIADIDPRPIRGRRAGEGGGLGDGALFAAATYVPLGWLVLRFAVRRRGDPAAPLERRRRRARRTLARDLSAARDARATLDSFTRFLAARTREPVETWTGRDPLVWGRDHARGAEAELTELRRTLAELERAVYGGGRAVERDDLLALADRLGRAGV